MLSILHWAEITLIILVILLLSLLFYISSKFKEMVRQKEYVGLIRLLKKYKKFRFVNPSISFFLANAAYLYGDEPLFHEAAEYSLRMKRTSRTLKHILRCFDTVFAFVNGRQQEGMEKVQKLLTLKPASFGKRNRKAAESLTALVNGIAAFYSDDCTHAKALLLQAYANFDAGTSKSVCSQYLARIFTESGDTNQGKELLRWARAYAYDTLYVASLETPPEDASLCPVHPGQAVVEDCRLCGAPVCMKCLNEHHGQICRECFQKELQIKKMTSDRKDARNYLIACTAVVAGCFTLFTLQMHSLYFSFPLFFQSIHDPYPWNVLHMAGIYTLMISGLFNGIWLFIRFIRNRSRATKITLAVLSIVTFAMIYAAGVFLLVPAYLFYLGRYIYLRRKITAQIKS